jgi:hypothetical protein
LRGPLVAESFEEVDSDTASDKGDERAGDEESEEGRACFNACFLRYVFTLAGDASRGDFLFRGERFTAEVWLSSSLLSSDTSKTSLLVDEAAALFLRGDTGACIDGGAVAACSLITAFSSITSSTIDTSSSSDPSTVSSI